MTYEWKEEWENSNRDNILCKIYQREKLVNGLMNKSENIKNENNINRWKYLTTIHICKENDKIFKRQN